MSDIIYRLRFKRPGAIVYTSHSDYTDDGLAIAALEHYQRLYPKFSWHVIKSAVNRRPQFGASDPWDKIGRALFKR